MRKVLSLVACLLLLLSMRYVSSCQKELMDKTGNTGTTDTSTNPTPVNAVYSLAGAPGNCDIPVQDGLFLAGIAVAASNNVQLNVIVTIPGNYRIYTDTINGLSFSATGSFVSTGLQQVKLYATGTPLSTGKFSFTPSTGTEACSFDITVEDAVTLADYRMIAGPGDPGACAYTVTGTYSSGLELDGSNNATIAIDVLKKGNYTITTNQVNGFSFSASGTFITLGRQVINIYGRGTPVNKGIFSFIPRIVGPHTAGPDACSFDVTVQ